jgi:ribosome-associated translation inhibitor RaiA
MHLSPRRAARAGEIVHQLCTAIASGTLLRVEHLFSPDVTMVADGREYRGPASVMVAIEKLPIHGARLSPELTRVFDGFVNVSWPLGIEHNEATSDVEVRVRNGEIRSMVWTPRVPEPIVAAIPGSQYVVEGDVSEKVIELAKQHVARAIDGSRRRILFQRLKLTRLADPGAYRPFVAQVTLDVDGRMVRAEGVGDTMAIAIEKMTTSLRERLVRKARAYHSSLGPRPSSTSSPVLGPAFVELPPQDREIVRVKTVASEPMTVDEAVEDLSNLDYLFYLFRDLETGQDACVSQTTNGSDKLTLIYPAQITAPIAATVTYSDIAAPELTEAEAKEWMDTTGQRDLFFRLQGTEHGEIIYRRRDGHYGLLTPGTTPAP